MSAVLPHDIPGDVAERTGVAHGDVARHAECVRAGGDLHELEDTKKAPVVQMDVDVDAPPLGDAECYVELAFDIAVHAAGIYAANAIRS